MKRILCWSAAIVFAGGGLATAQAPGRYSRLAQAEAAPMTEEAGSPSDTAPMADPPAAPAPPAPRESRAWSGPGVQDYAAPVLPASASGGCSSCGQGGGACCDHVPSRLDGVWDTYCAEKTRRPSCSCECAGHGCDCRFGLPKFPKMSCSSCDSCVPHSCAPCAAPPCAAAPCQAAPRVTYSRPFSSYASHGQPGCATCNGGANVEAAPELDLAPPGELAPTPAPQAHPSDLPAEVAPPETFLPDLPPAKQPTPDKQGWLPVPRLQRLPL